MRNEHRNMQLPLVNGSKMPHLGHSWTNHNYVQFQPINKYVLIASLVDRKILKSRNYSAPLLVNIMVHYAGHHSDFLYYHGYHYVTGLFKIYWLKSIPPTPDIIYQAIKTADYASVIWTLQHLFSLYLPVQIKSSQSAYFCGQDWFCGLSNAGSVMFYFPHDASKCSDKCRLKVALYCSK